MEHRTEFNLANCINHWKSILLENNNMTIDNVTELESHLLDEIVSLKESGLTEEEAFLISQKRLGNINLLTHEFSKVNSHAFFLNKIIPYIKGVLIFLAFFQIAELQINAFYLFFKPAGINNNSLNVASIILLIATIIVFFTAFFFKYKKQLFNFHYFIKIPVLVSIVVLSKIMNMFSVFLMVKNYMDIKNIKTLSYNLNIFKSTFVIILLIVSFLVYYKSKKVLKIAN